MLSIINYFLKQRMIGIHKRSFFLNKNGILFYIVAQHSDVE